MADLKIVDSCKDAFGDTLQVGDRVVFKSYDHLSKGVIKCILHDENALKEKYKWLLEIEREVMQQFGSRVEPPIGIVRSLKQIAKLGS